MKIDRVIPFWNNSLNLRIFYVLNSDKFAFDSYLFPIFDSTDIQRFEMFDSISISHPECSITFFIILKENRSNSVLDFSSPFAALITPVAFPFKIL